MADAAEREGSLFGVRATCGLLRKPPSPEEDFSPELLQVLFSPLSPFLPELFPIFEPLLDLAFEAAFDRLIDSLTAKLLRPIILAREGLRRVVIVLVTRAIAFVSS